MNPENRKLLQGIIDKHQRTLILMLDVGVGYFMGAIGMAIWEMMIHSEVYLAPGGWRNLLSTVFGAGLLTGTTHLRQKAKGLSQKEQST